MLNERLNEVTTTICGAFSASTLTINFVETVDLVWKIVGIASGIIAIVTFVLSRIKKIKAKIDKAKEDGKITKEEAVDITSEVYEDSKTVAEMIRQLDNEIKNDGKDE